MIRRLAVAAALVALLAVGCGDDGGEPAEPGASTTEQDPAAPDAEITLEVADGSLVGGVRREKVSLGDTVRIVVAGDSTDQVHVHGYDRYIDLVDGAGELTFTALIPGIFEIELEEAGRLLVQMEVS